MWWDGVPVFNFKEILEPIQFCLLRNVLKIELMVEDYTVYLYINIAIYNETMFFWNFLYIVWYIYLLLNHAWIYIVKKVFFSVNESSTFSRSFSAPLLLAFSFFMLSKSNRHRKFYQLLCMFTFRLRMNLKKN